MSIYDSKSGQPFVISPEELAKNFTVATKKEVEEYLGKTEPPPITKILEAKEKQEGKVSIERAKEIFGTDFLGAEAIEQTFGITFAIENLPEIPFSEIELERAKELGQFLVLRINSNPDEQGKPMTMKVINTLLARTQKIPGAVPVNQDWCKNMDFFKRDVPRAGWALVTKEAIPNTTGRNYLQQTQDLYTYLKYTIFANNTNVPQEYQDAFAEFTQYFTGTFSGKTSDEILELLDGTDSQKYARELGDLQINQLGRHTPVEMLYDYAVSCLGNTRQAFSRCNTWTNTRTKFGNLVAVGFFDNGDGFAAADFGPGKTNHGFGVFCSRTCED